MVCADNSAMCRRSTSLREDFVVEKGFGLGRIYPLFVWRIGGNQKVLKQ